MTDEQIIKDLHACIDEYDNRDCGECSQEDWRVCRDNLMKQALDLINQQEAKIELLKQEKKSVESNLLESENTYNGQTTKKTTFMTRIKTVYRFVNTEKPEEFIDTVTFAEGIDSQDKGSGKAMTYADKYALMKAYKISTGDDPDQTASEPTKYQKQSWRNELIKLLKAKGIDVNEYATAHGLSKSTTEDEYRDLVMDLRGE